MDGQTDEATATRVLVSCRDVRRTFRAGPRETRAVDGVDLEVASGEWVAIMGPSGCGKSSLLHLVGGLDTADAGQVVVGGDDLTRLSETRRAVLRRRVVGYVFQFFNLVQDLSVADNVELPMLLVGERRSTARSRRDALLEAVGLHDVARAMPSQLSGGQQQRVALARALANDPDLLLADEPTGNLDTEAARHVLTLLRERHAAGQAIVMVTHDPRVAAAADRIVAMQDGRITSDRATASGAAPEFATLFSPVAT